MSEINNILEINEAEFEEKVLKNSTSSLILVDFWAPWCGPCKQLTPILEKIINNSNNKVKLVKINIDENQQIAGQFRIQSIPAVFAFKDGQPKDAFQGVLPEKKIIEFIEKSLGEKIYEDHTDFYKNIEKLIIEKKFDEIKEMLENFMIDNPAEFKSFALYIDCLTDLAKYKEADIFNESLSEDALLDINIKASIQKLNIKKKNSNGPTLEQLKNNLNNNPQDLGILLSLSDKYFAENMLDETFELLLSNYKKDKDKIKDKFIEFFNALGNNNPKTIEYRKKLSQIMFS